MKYYVVSDVHSFFSEMRQALSRKGYFRDQEPHKLIVCGDLFDRGTESVKMQSFITDLMAKEEVILVRGNHEDLILELFEWNSSPIIYKTTKEWENISAIIDQYFVAKAGLYHYLSTAKSNYREYLNGKTVKFKKYFYVLRPLLACKWILAEGTPPPMLFKTLMDKYLEEEVKPDVLKLLDVKMNSPEITEGKRFDRVNDYIDKNIAQIEEVIKNLPDKHEQSWKELNKIFIDLL